jgi:anthranilate synthase/aminodeoxychorismate synthase-like glutamine amidotransferase
MKILLIDHYDSFTYNLAHQFWKIGIQLDVYAHDQISLEWIQHQEYSHYVLSPGPGHPKDQKDFNVSSDLLASWPFPQPLLGVCLGHQGIARFFGAQVHRAPQSMHGKISQITHSQSRLFKHIPVSFKGMRYHSLCVDPTTLPSELIPTAWSKEDGVLMAFEHQSEPLFGIQFHPESIGTPWGDQLIQNFIDL